jgi:hypothetical protein
MAAGIEKGIGEQGVTAPSRLRRRQSVTLALWCADDSRLARVPGVSPEDAYASIIGSVQRGTTTP